MSIIESFIQFFSSPLSPSGCRKSSPETKTVRDADSGRATSESASSNATPVTQPVLSVPSLPQPLHDTNIKRMLSESWNQYKLNFIEKDGRPIGWDDKEDIDGDGNLTETQTYSETVGFVLLRAVLADDRETFDRVWRWAEKNLQRKNIGQVYNWNTQSWQNLDPAKKDALMAWRYLPTVKGRHGGIID